MIDNRPINEHGDRAELRETSLVYDVERGSEGGGENRRRSPRHKEKYRDSVTQKDPINNEGERG